MAYSKEPITPALLRKAAPTEGGGGKTSFDPTVRVEPIPRLKPTMCCDFCGDDAPVVIYHSTKRTDGRPVIPAGAKVLRWASCEECSRLVDADDWTGVEDRVVERLKHYFAEHMSKAPESMIKEAAQAALKAFHYDSIRVA